MNASALDLFEACRRNDVAQVKSLCTENPYLLSVQDAKGYSPVLIAVYNNAPEAAQILLEMGAPASLPDASGNSALMGATFKGLRQLVSMLLHSGVDVNQQNGSGATALTFAATFNRMEIAQELLEHGALLHLTDALGKNPIDHAVIQENEPMVRLMEQYERKQAQF